MLGGRCWADVGTGADLWKEVEVNELDERRLEPEVKADVAAGPEPEGVCRDAARGGQKLGQLLSGRGHTVAPDDRLHVYIYTYIYVAAFTVTIKR